MARKTDRNYSGGIPFNLRIPQGLYAQIKEASRKTGLSIPDIVRLSAESGIHSLKRLNYNIARAISLQAETPENHPCDSGASKKLGGTTISDVAKRGVDARTTDSKPTRKRIIRA